MSTPAASALTKASIPTKLYQLLIKSAEPLVPKKLQPLWNHPAGNFAKIRLGFFIGKLQFSLQNSLHPRVDAIFLCNFEIHQMR